ncbi:hypothetical protein D3C72_1487450 [compost metagenome]
MPGAEGRGKQHRATRGGQARADEAGGDYIAQAQLREVALALEVALADVEQELLIEQFGDPAKVQHVEVKPLQCTVQPLRVIVEVVTDAGAAR